MPRAKGRGQTMLVFKLIEDSQAQVFAVTSELELPKPVSLGFAGAVRVAVVVDRRSLGTRMVRSYWAHDERGATVRVLTVSELEQLV